MSTYYRGRHVTSAKDFDRKTLEEIFKVTELLKKKYETSSGRKKLRSLLVRDDTPVRVRLLFAGSSTRTSSSFEDAIEALGGAVKKDLLEFSSMKKGETIRSTARILGPRCDAIVIRDDHDEGAAKKMADAVEDYGLPTVIINAGDGNREHPTQMLLDLYTIQEEKPGLFERGMLTYALVGDLADSRTIHSLLLGLTHFGGKTFLVGPPNEDIPRWLSEDLEKCSRLMITKIEDARELYHLASSIDVWYFTRLQKNLKAQEPDKNFEARYAKAYGATEKLRSRMKSAAVALHPLPHGPEYPEGIDLIDSRFIHYRQADNGFYVRMALLKLLFSVRKN